MKIKGFLLIIIFLLSIDNSAQERVTIDYQNISNFDISDFGIVKRIVKLENNNNTLIDDIFNIKKSDDGKLFIQNSMNDIQVFSSEGELLNIVGKRGKAPDEYLSLMDFDIDEKYIFILDFKKINIYKHDGVYIKSIPLDGFIQKIYVHNKRIHLIKSDFGVSEKESKFNLNFLVIKDYNGAIISETLLTKTKVFKVTGSMTKSNYMSFVANEKFIYTPVFLPESFRRDTIYSLSNGKLTPQFKVDFKGIGNYGVDKSNLYIDDILNSKKFIYSNFDYNRKKYQTLINKSENTSMTTDEGFKYKQYGIEDIYLKPFDLNKDQFYFYKHGYELEGIIDGIDENSNPVIFVVELE